MALTKFFRIAQEFIETITSGTKLTITPAESNFTADFSVERYLKRYPKEMIYYRTFYDMYVSQPLNDSAGRIAWHIIKYYKCLIGKKSSVLTYISKLLNANCIMIDDSNLSVRQIVSVTCLRRCSALC